MRTNKDSNTNAEDLLVIFFYVALAINIFLILWLVVVKCIFQLIWYYDCYYYFILFNDYQKLFVHILRIWNSIIMKYVWRSIIVYVVEC